MLFNFPNGKKNHLAFVFQQTCSADNVGLKEDPWFESKHGYKFSAGVCRLMNLFIW